jgi:aminoglycoside phosphotransferase (APT) family kinase protein
MESISPLPGATSSVLHSVRVNYKGRILALVLRQFVDTEWLAIEPDLVLHEAAALVKAASAGIPTPELIAYDEHGYCCGVPATLMTLLPGRVELMPADLDLWLDRLAVSIIPIHALEAGDFPWSYYPYSDISRLEPPVWSSCPGLWEKAIEVVTGPRPHARGCFIHRDYHPNNVLWEDSRVSGIVDWVNACRGPAGIDVAWCRQNLAQLYGAGEADRFLSIYRHYAGTSFEYHPYWDLIAAIEFLPGPPGVYGGWPAFGVGHLDEKTIEWRVDAYLASVVNRL